MKFAIGMVFVALAAMLFASKGIFGKLLYQRGVGFELLVTVRALIAMPLFGWMMPRCRKYRFVSMAVALNSPM